MEANEINAQLIKTLEQLQKQLNKKSATGAVITQTAGLGKDIFMAIFKRAVNILKALAD